MSSWVLLAFALVGAGLVANATWPTRGPKSIVVSWIGVFLTVDLAFHHIAIQAIVVTICYWLGALETWQGKVAIVLLVISDLQLIRLWLPNLKAPGVAAETATAMNLDEAEPVPGSLTLKPFARTRKGVVVEKNIEFWRVAGKILELDVYRPESNADDRPALVYVHGGGWLFGDKREQGIPLCNHMASLGWVCFNVNYRLSPHATFPDHLIDLKTAVAWIREHAHEYGADPDFIVVAGGSAGGHLASLLALTPNEPEYQPGFEEADTRVQGCVSYYGVYDFTNQYEVWPHESFQPVLERHVMKASYSEDPGAFEKASPIHRLGRDDPPFMVVHGDRDTLVPVDEARVFVEEFRKVVEAPMVYAEIQGAQHAFELFPSLRSQLMTHGVERFLAWLRSEHARRSGAPSSP